MLNFDTRVKNSDAAQPRVTNVKTPIGSPSATCLEPPDAELYTWDVPQIKNVNVESHFVGRFKSQNFELQAAKEL